MQPLATSTESPSPATEHHSLAHLESGQRFARFMIHERLGAGGAGTVYHATDLETHDEIALKLLNPEACAHETSRIRFMREFRAIARLEHPSCLKVLREGQHDGLYYYTMEFVRGGDLEHYRGAEASVLFSLIDQITQALAHIHSHRIVHRDLKPQNILIDTRSGAPQVKLADFGIAKELDDKQHSMTRTGMIIGTVGYMAPEQIRGEQVDPRTDLYALGCMIFELFTGQPPFVSPKGIFEVLRAHLEVPAPSIRARAPELPEALDALVAKLLAKSPSARYQSAVAVLEALRAIRDDYEHGERTLERGPSFVYRPAMVGREREREALLAAINAMHSPGYERPLFASLCAPAGMGKSRLIDALIRDLQVRDAVVISASIEADPDALFAPFPDLEAQIAFALQEIERKSLNIDWSAETIQPGVAPQPRYVPTLDSPAVLDPDIIRRARAQTIKRNLLSIGEHKPVVLILEDLHAIKPSALELLSDLLSMLATDGETKHPPAILLTSRPGKQHQQLHQSFAQEQLIAIDLAPLTPDEVETLLGQMLGQAQDLTLLDRLVSQVLAQTEGNPLFVQAYLQNIVEKDVLKRTREGWTFEVTANTQDLLPRSMSQVLADRLAMLDDQTYQILRAASAIGRSFDYALLKQVAQVQEGELLDALDEALRNWIIRSVPGPKHLDLYAFDHAKLVDVLYEQISTPRRRSLHQLIAQALEERQEPSAQLLALHYAQGQDPSKALHYLDKAADEASQAHDHAQAQAHLEQAIALLQGSPQLEQAQPALKHELIERLADAHQAQGQHAPAIASLRQLQGQHTQPAQLARIARKLGRSLYFAGQTTQGLEALEGALTTLGAPSPKHRVGLFMQILATLVLAWVNHHRAKLQGPAREVALERARVHRDLLVMYYWVDVERSTLHQCLYLRASLRIDEPTLLVEAYASHLVMAKLLRLNGRVTRYRQLAQQLAHKVGDTLGLSRLYNYSAVAASFYADKQDFLAQHDQALQLAEQAQDRFNLGFTMMSGGWCGMLVDSVARSRDLFERTVALGDQLKSPRVRADGLAGLGAIMALSDEPMEEIAQEVIRTGQELQIPASLALGHEVYGAHYFFKEDFESALKHLTQARDAYIEHRLFGTWGYMIGFEYAEALLNLADQRGEALNSEQRALLRRNIKLSYIAMRSLPPFKGFLEVMQGTVDARSGRPAKALKRFERALVLRAPFGQDYLSGWIFQRIALELARMGQQQRALELLDRYDQIFAPHPALGLRRWGQRARDLVLSAARKA